METKITSQSGGFTTVFRRWHTTKKDYIDSEGSTIPRPGLPRRKIEQESFPDSEGDPAVPPRDGSAPFLSLPTELRLQIYSYLTAEKKDIREVIRPQSIHGADGNKIIFTYLWRSPGRITKANAINPDIVRLFHVSRLMRLELIDSCFRDRIFVLEASLYRRSVGGLDVLPRRLEMTAWIKKLLLITTLDHEKLRPNGIADLRPLQEMVNLKELRILFRAMDPVIPDKISNSPIHAVMQCVPARTKVTIGLAGTSEEELRSELSPIEYLFSGNANGTEAYDRLSANLDQMAHWKGIFSGSRKNHGGCKYPTCCEQHTGFQCVNAQTKNAFPAPQPITGDGPFKYPCGCGIKSNDGGYQSHECSQRRKESATLVISTPLDLEQGKEARAKSWRDYLHQRVQRRSGGRE